MCGQIEKLRYLYTNVKHLGNKMEELKILIQDVKPVIIGIRGIEIITGIPLLKGIHYLGEREIKGKDGGVAERL